MTNNNDSFLATGNTNKTVGKAINQDTPQELNQGDIINSPIPIVLTVLIKDTMPHITKDKKKGTKKIMALTGNLGMPKIVFLP